VDLLQVPTCDSTSCLDSICYHRHRFQQLVRSLEALCWIFLKEFLNESNDWLWNIFESLKRQGRVLMLIHDLSGRTSEWCLASHHHPERYSKRVQIRADVHANSRELLWAGKFGCPGKRPVNSRSATGVAVPPTGVKTPTLEGAKRTSMQDPSHSEATITVPISIRLPARHAYLLYLNARQMNTSAAKLLTLILEDVLPAFANEDSTVRLRSPQIYKLTKDVGLLKGVNADVLKNRILKRTEPGGNIGRPPKLRSVA
jgi:hypothetical protein